MGYFGKNVSKTETLLESTAGTSASVSGSSGQGTTAAVQSDQLLAVPTIGANESETIW